MKETPFGCGESAWVSGRANNTGCAKVLRDAAAQLYCAESEWEGRKGAIMGSPAHLVHSLRESKVHCAESEWEGRKGAIMGSPAHLVHSLRESKVRAAHARRVELLRARRPHREQEVGGLEVAVDQLAAVHVRHGAHDALEHAGDTRLAAHPPPPHSPRQSPPPPSLSVAAVAPRVRLAGRKSISRLRATTRVGVPVLSRPGGWWARAATLHHRCWMPSRAEQGLEPMRERALAYSAPCGVARWCMPLSPQRRPLL
jgi:hypothetical protein